MNVDVVYVLYVLAKSRQLMNRIYRPISHDCLLYLAGSLGERAGQTGEITQGVVLSQ